MKNTHWLTRGLAVLAMAAIALTGMVSGATPGVHATSAGAPQLVFDGKVYGTAQYSTNGSANPSHTGNTIPYWQSSFTWNGTTYPYAMVGTAPSTNASTTITTWIIPLNFVFSDGVGLDGTTDVQSVLSSPIYKNNPYNTFAGKNLGTTQYGDAIQRVEFNKVGTGYHVQLSNGQTLPTQTIKVPSNQGFEVAGEFGLMSAAWFSAQENNLLGQLHVPSNVLPIFLTDSVFLYEGSTSNCCILGWHGASSSLNGNGNQQVQTFIYAAYSKYDFFGSAPIMDIHALSHEVSEWQNDPFGNNVVPSWSVPFEPQYGCSSVLETGDPLVGFSPNNNLTKGWHPQDIPLAPWFMRQTTASGAINPGSLANTYTYPDTASTLANEGAFGFDKYSPGC